MGRRNEVDKWLDRLEDSLDPQVVKKLLLKKPINIDEACGVLKTSRGKFLKICRHLEDEGANLFRNGEIVYISREGLPTEYSKSLHHLKSDAKGGYRFGLVADTHLGSKYQRLDVCEALYDWFAKEGITKVYHAGNWIEGERRFNRFDLLPEAHGMQAQLDYFVKYYPQRRGITTYYVTGDDHEGWYSQDFGVDIGWMLEQTAEEAGRDDLKDLGYMEAFITLEHRRTGNTSKMLVSHPGMGSAYATSYAPQKVIEVLQSGEKPGLIAFGHWHKQMYMVIRDVHTILVPCTKDVDTFARKKRLTYTIGGVIVELQQDPQGGLGKCSPQFKLFFDRGYYNHQFNLARPIRKIRAPHGKR